MFTCERVHKVIKNDKLDSEFIYCELKQNTAEIINKITNAKTTDKLLAIKNSIKDYTFVDYRINLEFLKDNSDNEFKDFADLHLEEQ